MTVNAAILIYTSPTTDAVDKQFNDWYDSIHVPQILERIPGIVSAQRYKLSAEQMLPPALLPERQYVAIYSVDSDNLQGVVDKLASSIGDGTLDMTEHMNMTDKGPLVHYYSKI